VLDIYNADEIFLTNAIRGMRWVELVDEKLYKNTITKQVFAAFSEIIFEHFGEHLV
jgi:branched-subunit amino acid aminotransferase/4-amino-4-deoxychorismate lyase